MDRHALQLVVFVAAFLMCVFPARAHERVSARWVAGTDCDDGDVCTVGDTIAWNGTCIGHAPYARLANVTSMLFVSPDGALCTSQLQSPGTWGPAHDDCVTFVCEPAGAWHWVADKSGLTCETGIGICDTCGRCVVTRTGMHEPHRHRVWIAVIVIIVVLFFAVIAAIAAALCLGTHGERRYKRTV
jgi:hypothetical protein